MSEIQERERPDESTYDLDALPGEPGDGVELEPERPNKSASAVGQPLPRLWKTEPDPADEPDETDPKRPLTTTAKGGDEHKPTLKTASTPKAKPKPPKVKAKPRSTDDGDEKDKKVLVEDTPTFDTIEARQRARLIVGALGVFCLMLVGYIGYRILFGGSSAVDFSPEEPAIAQSGPAAGPSPDREAREARYMLSRAQEFAKRGQTDQAVGMLKRVVASYKATESAAEARAALERPRQNLPLFPDGPAVVAVRKPVGPPPAQATAPSVSHVAPPTATGPLAMGPAPVATSPAQPQAQPVPTPPPQAQPAPTPPPQAQPASPPQAQAQVAQSPPPQAQPTQPAPPSGPGQVAVLVPAPARGAAEMPAPAERADTGRDAAAPRALPQRVLPSGFKARVEAGLHESGWPLVIVGERDGGPMVLVPGGTFTMGNDSGEPVEAPSHTVRLSTFYIDQYEVTNRQFRTFLDDAHYRGQPPGKWLTEENLREGSAAAPAVRVSYRDAETFAIWAGKRLPTEAQWEMAARSTDGRRYPWGDQPIKWSRPREFRRVEPVMSFPEDVSAYGVFDMAGNVMEWTRDWYEPRYFAKIKDKVVENPTGPATQRQNSIQRVVKGGSKNEMVTARQGVDLDKRLPYLGFRCSLAVEGPEASAGISPHPVKPDAQPGTPPPGAGPPGGDVPF
jgi:formylglycine-generating enzyme required for sulfatase activity